jgi:hypothetical protein
MLEVKGAPRAASTSPAERYMPEARQFRHCRHCAGGCPGDCLLGDGQCIHGWNEKRPGQFTWQALLTRRLWDRVLWGVHGRPQRG